MSVRHKHDTDIPADSALADWIAFLGLHMQGVHTTPPKQQPQDAVLQQPHTERIQKPRLRLVEGEITEEEWEYFNHKWEQFKGLARVGVQGKVHLSTVLWDVSQKVYKRLATLLSRT